MSADNTAHSDEPHRHSNPSPSHCIAAWCNGTADDPGCGQVVPLYWFKDRRQDEGPHESYLIDGRDVGALLKAIDGLNDRQLRLLYDRLGM